MANLEVGQTIAWRPQSNGGIVGATVVRAGGAEGYAVIPDGRGGRHCTVHVTVTGRKTRYHAGLGRGVAVRICATEDTGVNIVEHFTDALQATGDAWSGVVAGA